MLLHQLGRCQRASGLLPGEIDQGEDILVHVHSECFTGEVLGSTRCDCGEQLNRALQMISKEGRGALIYMRQEGRGIGLMKKSNPIICRMPVMIPLMPI